MKSNYGRISIVSIMFYLAGIGITVYTLIILPDELARRTGQLDLELITSLRAILLKTGIISGITFALGLTAIWFAMKKPAAIMAQKTSEAVRSEQDKHQQSQTEDKTIAIDEQALIRIQQGLKKADKNSNVYDQLLGALAKELEICQAAYYLPELHEDKRIVKLVESYAFSIPESKTIQYEFGEGLIGQAAREKKKMIIDDVPQGYLKVISGLGSASPAHLVIMPVCNEENNLVGIAEFASFKKLTSGELELIERALAMPGLTTGEETNDAHEKQKKG
ncbi:MAG: GAF domain-containing protein [Cyclobacteriaceae bacterium]|nr:GAF domain-containing protein [Cyclobacteriaceae bacterium]